MKRLDMLSADMTQQQLHALRALFPHCVTEAHDAHGHVTLKVDFDLLKQELSPVLIDDAHQERYQLNWPGKRQAIVAANTPIAKTLRPVPAESVDFDTTQHLFIEGDNLDALKLLQETYLGKVKLIYIDPPYNTGNDFIYRDHFATDADTYLKASGERSQTGERLTANLDSNGRFHSDWLSMMYPRLKLARNLLREDGVIFISIDDNEVHNLKKICAEIFGEDNFVAIYVWKARSGKDHTAQYASITQEYLVCYCKSKAVTVFGKDIRQRVGGNFSDERGPYRREPLRQWSSNDRREDRPTMFYPVQAPDGSDIYPIRADGSDGCWRINKDRMHAMIHAGDVDFVQEDGAWRLFAKQRDGEITQTAIGTLIEDAGTASTGTIQLKELFAEKVFPTTKPTQLVKKLMQISSVQLNDIVLDFFAGSSTTAHAVMQLNAEDGGNRQFIMVQLPEVCPPESEAAKARFPTIAEISKERIRRAGAQILRDWQVAHHAPATQNFLTQTAPMAPDVGFRVLKIDSSNMHEVFYVPDTLVQGQLTLLADNIKPDRTSLDLLFQVMLDWGVELSLPIGRQRIGQHDVYTVAGNALVACFDAHVDEALVRTLTQLQPLRMVFRDGGFVSDAVKINVSQIFAQLSPLTEVRVI
jgi:adenine-specific DNA-methyltransferase